MARVKKIRKYGKTVYPVTVSDAVIIPDSGKTVTEGLNDFAQKLSEDCELTPGIAYYTNNGKLNAGMVDNYQATGFRKSDGTGIPVTLNKGDEIYVKASADSKTGNLTVLITSVGGASVGKTVIESFDDTQNGKKYVATQDCEVYVSNNMTLEPNPIVRVMAEQYTSKSYVDNKVSEERKYVYNELAKKQNTLVSGENIKTINGQSLLSEGDIKIDGINPWNGKKMLVMGASSIGIGSTSTEYPKYYSYAIRTAELLGMQLVDRTSNPRIYAAGGKTYQWKSDSLIVYTDLTETEFTTWDNVSINYYHFQEQRGDRSLKWSFVSYDAETKKLVLKKDGTNHTFALDTSVSQPLAGLFNLGASATIAEYEATGRADRKRESYENYLLDTSIDLVVFGGQGIEVDAVGEIDEQIVPLMRRPTQTNPHFHYSDGVSLKERRNSNTGSVLYLIDKVLSVNPKARFVICQDGNLPKDQEGREDWGLARTQGYGRFKWDAVMAVKFGIPYLNHAEKLMLNYANWSVYGATDKTHPSEEMYKWMGEMFAGELIAGTMNDAATAWFSDIVEQLNNTEYATDADIDNLWA